MPFGLCNAPGTFQRLMNKVFADNLGKVIAVYLDDILIFSRDMEEHWKHLRWALDRLQEAKLYGRLHKCKFLKDQVEYLGFEVSPRGIQASPGKVRAIIDWPRPKGVHDVRSFLGLASYYRRFVRGFSEMARPLTALTRAGIDWEWCGNFCIFAWGCHEHWFGIGADLIPAGQRPGPILLPWADCSSGTSELFGEDPML